MLLLLMLMMMMLSMGLMLSSSIVACASLQVVVREVRRRMRWRREGLVAASFECHQLQLGLLVPDQCSSSSHRLSLSASLCVCFVLVCLSHSLIETIDSDTVTDMSILSGCVCAVSLHMTMTMTID